jgi:hypothetical protein
MAKWILTSKAYDHRFDSGAVLALPAEKKVYVPDDIADEAIKLGAAKKCDKPADDDPQRMATATVEQTNRVVPPAATVVTGGFPGYPSYDQRRAAEAEAELAALGAGDRSEAPEETVATNELVAKTEKTDEPK